MSPIFSLAWDVQEHILSWIPPGDAFTLAQTCHDARSAATPFALAHVCVGCPLPCESLQVDVPQLNGFYDYLKADGSHRFSCIRSMIVHASSFDAAAARRLSNIISQAMQLISLRIIDVETLLDLHPGLAGAINSLERLKHLTLLFGGPLSSAMLEGMRSHPQELELSYDPDEPVGCVASFLQRATVARSLRVLMLGWCPLTAFVDMAHTIWPSVRTLYLCGNINLTDLARAFPALHTLSLRSGTFFMDGSASTQELWPELDHLEITPGLLPTRICTVRRLTLTYPIFSAFTEFIMFLEQASPLVLTTMARASICTTEALEKLAHAAPRLQFLEFLLFPTAAHVPDSYIYQETMEWMTRLAALRTLPLVGFLLRTFQEPWDQISAHGVAALALVIASCIPSLEYVSLGMLPELGATHVWYRVVARPEDGQPLLEMLTTKQGSDVEERMYDLVLL